MPPVIEARTQEKDAARPNVLKGTFFEYDLEGILRPVALTPEQIEANEKLLDDIHRQEIALSKLRAVGSLGL